MHSTITVVLKHAEMSVKNDASSIVEQINILISYNVNVPETRQSCDDWVIKAILRLRIAATSMP